MPYDLDITLDGKPASEVDLKALDDRTIAWLGTQAAVLANTIELFRRELRDERLRRGQVEVKLNVFKFKDYPPAA